MSGSDGETALLVDIRFALRELRDTSLQFRKSRNMTSRTIRSSTLACRKVTGTATTLVGVCLLVGAVLAIAPEATAGFQNQYSDWEPLAEPQKFSYVAGFLDSFIDWRFPDGSVGRALGRGYEGCLVRQKLTPKILTGIIDTSYKQKVQRHKFSPGIVLMCELQKLCSDDLNRELKAAGFGEQSLAKTSIDLRFINDRGRGRHYLLIPAVCCGVGIHGRAQGQPHPRKYARKMVGHLRLCGWEIHRLLPKALHRT